MQKKYLSFIAIVILAFFAGNFSYPAYYNQATDFVNQKLHISLPHMWEKPFVLGLDLQGGVDLTYQADLTGIADKDGAMAGLRDVIENRVNAFGVSEPVVQIQGNDRLVVQLPGVKDVKQAIAMIGETPYLEFDEERTAEEKKVITDKILEVQLAQKNGKDASTVKDWQLALQNPKYKPTELTGKYLDKDGTRLSFDPTTNRQVIELAFNAEGAKLFEEITQRNIGKSIAIFLDGNSIIDTTGDGILNADDFYNPYAPVVQDKISGGKASITGNIPLADSQKIVSRLKQGALPVKIGSPISQESVGPTLGSVSLQKSLWAGIYGLLAVIIFMVVVYRLPGFLASIALMVYVAVALSIFKLVPVTMTLAGIGGFILSIGMAVDANILIFARMKEEIKNGRTLDAAIREGFHRAWPSIRDSNLNSLIVCAILFLFSTSFIKGFALTLSLGIVVSLFSAISVTRNLLLVVAGPWLEKHKWLL